MPQWREREGRDKEREGTELTSVPYLLVYKGRYLIIAATYIETIPRPYSQLLCKIENLEMGLGMSLVTLCIHISMYTVV